MGLFSKLFKQTVREVATPPKRRPEPEPEVEVEDWEEIASGPEPDFHAYLKLDNEIRELHSKRQIAKMLERCKAVLPLLPALVREEARSRRLFGGDEIHSAGYGLDQGLRYWSALGDLDNLGAASAALNRIPEFKLAYSEALERASADSVLSRKIQDHLRENPGAIQSKMGKALGVSGRDTGRIIGTLANTGVIERTKKGSSYELRLG